MAAGALLMVLAMAMAGRGAATRACALSELACANGRCVPANRYCDGVNDCGDSSDEPRACTPCNRTYYGDLGRTYDLELHRPKEERLPFLCRLTLTAAGGHHGDLVQLSFESLTLGRFASFTADGCPDGGLQLSEAGRPPLGGSWCGSSWGPVVYYSETHSLTLAVRLLRLAKDQSGYNFDFRLRYKMLSRDAAVVRYGGPPIASPSGELYLGDLIAGTYCSRIFSDCDRKPCRLQSPNFPGVYPRNLTCYYAVRQHDVPPGKHALIAVRQTEGRLVAVRSQALVEDKERPKELRVWADCDRVHDYVTVYDGYTTRDPVVLKFCGGGEPVPEAVSSGPELLVEFTTSPFGTFLHPSPAQTLHGFQLEVEVRFVDQHSPTYAKNKRACEFWLRGTGRGALAQPQHSLPPNATCLYHLQGIDTSLTAASGPVRPAGPHAWQPRRPYPPPRFRVWLSVLKFHSASALNLLESPSEDACAAHLNVWDGPLRIAPGCSDVFCQRGKERPALGVQVGKPPGNATLLARFCSGRGGGARACEHALLRPRARPCAPAESFLSTADTLTLELRLADSTSLRPVRFKALYEFVDLQQDGEPFGAGPCSRRFVGRSPDDAPDPPLPFAAPRDVFLYGRGGARNLSCVYRFEAQAGERVKITVRALTVSGPRSGRCTTRDGSPTSTLACLGKPKAALRIFEVPWPGAPGVPRDCLCSGGPGLLPHAFLSETSTLEVRFDAANMSAADDFNSVFFEATYEFVKMPACTADRRLAGSSGALTLPVNERDINCERSPWLVEPGAGRYMYVRVKGVRLKEPVVDEHNLSNNVSILHEDRDQCLTLDRIVLYPGTLPPVVVCPLPTSSHRDRYVQVFSEGWAPERRYRLADATAPPRSEGVAFELLGPGSEPYAVTWMEVARSRVHGALSSLYSAPEWCRHRCPELEACISADLWCDGVAHCPSGYDESLLHCSWLLTLPTQYLAALCATVLSCASVAVLYLVRRRRRRRSTAFQRRLESMSSDTAVFGDKEVIC